MKCSYGGVKAKGILGYLGVALAALAAGSFLDQRIAASFYFPGNPFGAIIAAVGELPGYLLLAASGLLFHFYLHDGAGRWRDGLGYAFLGGGTLAAGGLYGYDSLGDVLTSTLLAVGLGIVLVGASTVGLYYFLRKTPREAAFKAGLALLSAALLAVSLTYVLKLSVVRPRPFFVASEGTAYFRNWYDFLTGAGMAIPNGAASDALDSWPSGHATLAGLAVLAPLVIGLNEKTQRHAGLAFWLAAGWGWLVALGRMSDGHHYLSDVATGLLIGVGFAFLCLAFVFGDRPELANALAEKASRASRTQGTRPLPWDQWRLHAAQRRKEKPLSPRRSLALRQANNALRQAPKAKRPHYRLAPSKKSNLQKPPPFPEASINRSGKKRTP